jgi:hypothetical protein
MSIKESPHFELPSLELARWLEEQGPDRWWTVDGDPLLGGYIFLPCPGNELAVALRKLDRPLLLADKDEKPEAHGQIVRAEDLDRLADPLRHWSSEEGEVVDRAFYLSWKGSDIDWMLVEDALTSASELRDASSEREAS